ncbi:MAG: RNA-guided endonuclease InsQ/TnpB family protein, partial [Shewanella sp.]
MKCTKTLKLRVKDKHKLILDQQSKSVNFVWNYINELSSRAIKERGRFLSAFDIHPYTKGANKELGLHSQTLQCIAKEYV